jgi:MFS family permease
MVVGTIGFGTSISHRELDKHFWFVPIFFNVISAIGGAIFFYCMMGFSRDAPKYAGYIIAVTTCGWDFSTLIYYLFNIVYFKTNLTLEWIFIGYTSILAIPLFLFSWFIEPPVEELNDEEKRLNVQEERTIEAEHEYLVQKSLSKELFTKKSLFMYLWFLISVLFCYYYLSTILDQAYELTHHDQKKSEKMNSIFSLMLPLGGVFTNYPFGKLVGNLPLSFAFLGVTVIACTITSILPIVELQYFTYIVFISWRIFLFIVLYAFVAKAYSPKNFGRISSICLSIAGFVSFSITGLDDITVYYLNNNFVPMNLVLGLTSGVSTFLFAIYVYRILNKH